VRILASRALGFFLPAGRFDAFILLPAVRGRPRWSGRERDRPAEHAPWACSPQTPA